MAERPAAAGDGEAVYEDAQLVVSRTSRPAGFRFVGEIDIMNSGAIQDALMAAVNGEPNPHFDMSRLVFRDVSGIRNLVSIASMLGPERRLLLHGLPEELERVIRITGWAEEPGFSFCGCTEAES